MSRVVITGLGAVSPCGNDARSSWASAVAGRSGIGPITCFDARDWPVQIAGEVKDFQGKGLSHADRKRMDRFSQFAMVAALEAVEDAWLPVDGSLGERTGVYIGTVIGGVPEIAENAVALQENGVLRLSPFFIPRSLPNLAGGHVAMRLGAQGPSLCISTACATGNHSIGEAARVIRSGDADIVVAGGSEAAIIPLGLGGFMVMKALSRRNDDPLTASRPFDRDRDGLVNGEGAGAILLEAREHAERRGARIRGELLAATARCEPRARRDGLTGASLRQAIRGVCAAAGLGTGQVGHVNAHGVGTVEMDRVEARAIAGELGDLPVTAPKSYFGHLGAGGGVVELAASILGLEQGLVPPTLNYEHPDPECPVNVVSGTPLAGRPPTAVKVNLCSTGQAVALAIRH